MHSVTGYVYEKMEGHTISTEGWIRKFLGHI